MMGMGEPDMPIQQYLQEYFSHLLIGFNHIPLYIKVYFSQPFNECLLLGGGPSP